MLHPFLARLTCRSFLSLREREEILDLPYRMKQVPANQDFVPLRQQRDHVNYVVAGLVGRFDQNAKGDRQITALHIKGDMPDLHSVVQPTATPALHALTSSTILEVPNVALRQVASAHPAIAEAFWRDCTVDSMVLAQWVVNAGRRDARTRIAHLLCEMACRYRVEPVDGKLAFELPMTQSQLADATSLSSVHVNRTFKSLADLGTSFQHKRVRIEDWDALVEVADFDRTYLQDNLAPEERIKLARRLH